jgi:hypothetical protein
MTAIGHLDQHVTLWAPTDLEDGHAALTGCDWRQTGEAMARADPMRATDAETQGGLRNIAIVRFAVHRPVAEALAPGCAIEWLARRYLIRDIRLDGASQFIDIYAETGGVSA